MAFLHFLLRTRLIIKIIFDFYLDTYLLMCYKIHKFHFSKFFTYTSHLYMCRETSGTLAAKPNQGKFYAFWWKERLGFSHKSFKGGGTGSGALHSFPFSGIF